MFDILEGIVEHIILFFNIPNRPFITALVKSVLSALAFFFVVRIARFIKDSIVSKYFVDDIKLSLIIGGIAFTISLLGRVFNWIRHK